MKKPTNKAQSLLHKIRVKYAMQPIRKAINACADDDAKKAQAIAVAKTALLSEGLGPRAALKKAGHTATTDSKKREKLMSDLIEAAKTRRYGIVAVSSLAVVLVVVLIARSFFPIVAQAAPVGDTSAADTTTVQNISVAIEVMGAHGLIYGEDYVFAQKGETDGAAQALNGDYAPKGLYSHEELINFLQTEKKGQAAHIAMVDLCKETSSKNELNIANYWFIKMLCDFEYQDNTGMYEDGTIYQTGKILQGHAGEIFILYISPETGIELTIRAACGNIQFLFPVKVNTPEETTPTPTTTCESTTKGLGVGAFIDNNVVNYDQGENTQKTDEQIGVVQVIWNGIKDIFTNDPGTEAGEEAAGDDVIVLETREIPPEEDDEVIATIVHSETNEEF